MRITLLAPPLTGRGGMETCIRNLAAAAKKAGDEVKVLALGPSQLTDAWQQGLDYQELTAVKGRSPIVFLLGTIRLALALRRLKPDAVIGMHASGIAVIRIAQAMVQLRATVACWVHFSLHLKQRTGLMKWADRVLCINTDLAQAMEREVGIDPARIFLVYNGTEMNDLRPIPRSTDGVLRILHIGRLQMGGQKQTDELLRALARLQASWSLDVIGSGDDADALKALADDLGIAGRIVWRGWSSQPWDAVGSADVLVLCSTFEGFGMVLVEAMARGVPCISSDCRSGPSDIIREGVNGWLYPVGDEAALTGRLQNLADDPQRSPEPSAVVYSVRDRFSSEAVYAQIRRALQVETGL